MPPPPPPVNSFKDEANYVNYHGKLFNFFDLLYFDIARLLQQSTLIQYRCD
ncbi:hypothetical protein PGB90_006129 [Kerria lacca]